MSLDITRLPTTRRRVLRGAGQLALTGAALTVAAPFIGRAAAAGSLKIGMIIPKTGSLTEQGEYLSKGTPMALEQAGGKVLGQPAELIWLDEPDPQTAQQNMQKLITEEKVIAVVGGGTSATALAMASVAKRNKMPFFCNNAAAREITGKDCNRYTFRMQATVPVSCRALAPFLLPRGKKWYFITAAYAFGQDIYRSMSDLLRQAGGTEVGADNTPLGTTDFSSFMLKIRQTKPDVVIAGLPASDLSNFLKQFNEIGFKGKLPVATPNVGDTDMWAVGPDAVSGIYTKPWYYKDPNNPPEDQAFAAAFLAKYGKPAADKAWMAWYAMRMLLLGIEQAKSTEPKVIVESLEALRLMDGTMPSYVRAWDHQVVRRFLVAGIKEKITDNWDYFDILKQAPDKPEELEPLFGTKQEIGCTIGDL